MRASLRPTETSRISRMRWRTSFRGWTCFSATKISPSSRTPRIASRSLRYRSHFAYPPACLYPLSLCPTLLQLVKTDQENAAALTRLQEEAKTLRSALAAHAKLTRPVEPVLPLSGSFMEAIKASVVAQVQEHIVPIVTQTRTEFERIANARDMELYEKLKDKLDQNSRMAQVLSTWIEHNPDDARQALAAATASRAQVGGASSSGSVLA